jgi:hypothetical protein
VAPADRIIDRCHHGSARSAPVERRNTMRRALPVLLSAVLSALAVVGLDTSAAMARPIAAATTGLTAATEPGKVVYRSFTGTLAPWATKTAVWKNVLPDQVYDVSLSPVGASSSQDCRMQVRTWNEQRPEGNRDFWYTVQNVGPLACAANVMVYRIPGTVVRSTGGLAPGETKRFEQTSIDDSKVYRLGLLPSGSTSRDPCKLKVVRSWYTHRFQGDVATVFDVAYVVMNVGKIACQGDILLGSAPIEHSRSIGELGPYWDVTKYWNNASTATAYVPGLQPNLGCKLELLGSHDVQRINGDGSVEREVGITTMNFGTEPCGGRITLASI